MCKKRNTDEPIWVGFRGEGKGFFCFEIPEAEMEKAEYNSAMVHITGANLSDKEVEDEFKELVE